MHECNKTQECNKNLVSVFCGLAKSAEPECLGCCDTPAPAGGALLLSYIQRLLLSAVQGCC